MRALVLSGGGSRGAYQAGVVWHLLRDLRIEYDIIAGASVGALNGSFLAMYAPGETLGAAEGLRDLWFGISDKKVHKLWYGGLLGKLPALWKPSVFSSAPLRELVQGTLVPERMRASGKRLRVGAVSLESGARRVWSEQDDDIVQAVLASSAFPVFLEPVRVGGELYTDDGVREATPCEEAIQAGADHLDIVMCSAPGVYGKLGRPTALHIAKQCLAAQSEEVSKWDLKVIALYNALIRAGDPVARGKRVITANVIWPNQSLELDSSLDFTNTKARVNWARGVAEAQVKDWG